MFCKALTTVRRGVEQQYCVNMITLFAVLDSLENSQAIYKLLFRFNQQPLY